MKNKYIFILLVLFIVLFAYWFNRYPAFKNKDVADINISNNDTVIYYLKSIPTGDFKYYAKQEPEKIEFSYQGEKVVMLNNVDVHYDILIKYHDSTLSSVHFK